MADKDQKVTAKKVGKVAPKKKAASRKKVAEKKSQEHVSVEDMHRLLNILQDGLASRDKSVDYLQHQIALNQEQIEQNKKILAKRGILYKLGFALLAIGVLVVGFDQHTIIKSFDADMTRVALDMDKMLVEMSAMRESIEMMSKDMNTMSKGVTSIDTSVSSMSRDVSSMSYGVQGMSRDTREMNRSMNTMTPPWSPWK